MLDNRQSFMPQPYQYPPQQPLYAPAPNQPRVVPFTRSWHIAKIVLRSIELICAIVVLALTIALISTAPYAASPPLILSLPPACMSLIWVTAEFITLCARGGKLGIHPGAHVGVTLITWMYWVLGIAFMCLFSIGGDGTDFNYGVGLNFAILGVSVIASLVTFTLFVRACVETNQRNRQRGQIFVMAGNGGPFYVLPQGQFPQMQQYQQPMPMMPAAVYPCAPQPHVRDSKAPVTDGTLSNTVTSPADGSFYGPGNPYQQRT
ncbi:hypothetical protein ACHAQH_000828 [Verticillium albo-atrum]